MMGVAAKPAPASRKAYDRETRRERVEKPARRRARRMFSRAEVL